MSFTAHARAHVIPSERARPWARDGADSSQRADRLEGGPVTQIPIDELSSIRFEASAPVRKAPTYKGQKNFTGEWWCATTGSHLPFESWTERDYLISADFDPSVVGIAVQPFTFRFEPVTGKLREHTPDVFLRLRSGDAVIVDVRPDALVDDRAREAFEATAELCDQVGWAYLRSSDQAPIRAANLRWLAGYRNVRNRDNGVAAQLTTKLASGPMAIASLADAAGERVVVLPTLYHLLWTQEILADVETATLSGRTLVRVGAP